MTLRWAVALSVAGLVGACTVRTEGTAERIDDVPFALLDPEAPTVVANTSGRDVRVCLIDDGQLTTVTRRLAEDARLIDVVRAIGTLSEDEANDGLATTLGAPEEVKSVSVKAGTATIELAANAEQAIVGDPLTTVAQLVCTVTSQPGVGRVEFTVDGDRVDVPRADGSLTDSAVTRDDYTPLFATP